MLLVLGSVRKREPTWIRNPDPSDNDSLPYCLKKTMQSHIFHLMTRLRQDGCRDSAVCNKTSRLNGNQYLVEQTPLHPTNQCQPHITSYMKGKERTMPSSSSPSSLSSLSLSFGSFSSSAVAPATDVTDVGFSAGREPLPVLMCDSNSFTFFPSSAFERREAQMGSRSTLAADVNAMILSAYVGFGS
jgi:hypothetical protein